MSPLATLTGHNTRVLYSALSPDGQTVVTVRSLARLKEGMAKRFRSESLSPCPARFRVLVTKRSGFGISFQRTLVPLLAG